MGAKMLNTNITYSVVGRYMIGSKVSGYHIVGSDGSSKQVTKNQLIMLVYKGCISNCRVQMCNDYPILRGKGIDLGKLPTYNEANQQVKVGDSLINIGDPNKVFGQLIIKAKLIENGNIVGYMVEDISGTKKKLSTSRVLELALENQIGNAKISNGDKPTIEGIEVDISSLPEIHVKLNSTNRNDFIQQEKSIKDKVVKGMEAIKNVQNTKSEECPLIDISIDELMQFGKRNMSLNQELTNNLKSLNRPVGIQEIREGKARLYVQAEGKGNSRISEFVTIAVKFGKDKGIIMRVMHRGSKQVFDVREKTITNMSEKLALGIMCCGIDKRYKNIENFGIISIQSNDASSERVYEFD